MSSKSRTLPGYKILHYWVERQLGKPMKCDNCGTITAKRFEWANIGGEYKRDLSDWKRLCTSCHRFFDNANKCRRGHELTPENSYTRLSTGWRQCRLCRRIVRRKYYTEVELCK